MQRNSFKRLFGKFSFAASLLLFSYFSSLSQTMVFCEGVDTTTGNPKGKSSTFTISSGGGFLDLLVTMPNGVNSNFITYDLFIENENRKEVFESSIKQAVLPEYTWFYKEVTFHKPGIYNVYVYNDRDRLLCVGRVTIKTEK